MTGNDGFDVDNFVTRAKCFYWKYSRMQRADRMSKEAEYRQYKVSAVRYFLDTH